jgi:hypothetical protein
MKKISLIVKALLIVIITFSLAACGMFEGTLHEEPIFNEELWGEWIRMDTGETWYFASNYWMIENNYYTAPVDMVRESQNVIKVTEGTGVNAKQYFLYASRLRNSTFEASAVMDDISRALFSRAVNVPKGTIAAIEAIKNGMDKQTVEIGDYGEFEAENIIAGDDYKVTIDEYEFTVTPNTDGDNVGTLTLTNGVNIKTSILPQSSSTDLTRLFSGESYDLTIRFTNIGENDAIAMSYNLTLPNGLKFIKNGESLSILPGNLQTIEPERSRDVNVTILCEIIEENKTEEFEFKNITINTKDFYNKEWTDSVSLKVNNKSVTFNVRSDLAINGVVIVPNGKTYHFTTRRSEGICSAEVKVPKFYQKNYLVVFSGASADTETMYSFAVDDNPETNFNEYLISNLEYRNNNTEDYAPEVDSGKKVVAYLIKNQANYYKVKFDQ